MEYFEYSKNSTYAICKEDLTADFFNGEAVPVESRIRLGYGNNAEDYLNSGIRDVQNMLNILEKNNIKLSADAKTLDFGCGGGRMLRHLPTLIPDGQFWGCDTESRAISWAQTYLDPKLRFFTNLREPHLPFEDGFFDFIYAGSVFSHLHDMADFWMLELRRITKPETGILYLTFQDESSIEIIRRRNTINSINYYNKLFKDTNNEILFTKDYKKIVIAKDEYSSQVFYKTSWLYTLLTKFFVDVKLVQYGYGWQTAALLKKSDFDNLQLNFNAGFNSINYWCSRHEQYLADPRGVGNVSYSAKDNEQIYIAMNEYIEALVKTLNLPAPIKVLDLGCGTGMISGAFIRTGCLYTGIDISEKAIEIARLKHPLGTFCVGNVADLPFHEHFDIVIERTVFIHLVEDDYWRAVISEVKRILSSDGIFILMDSIPETEAEVTDKVEHVKLRLVKEYLDIFQKVGLSFHTDLKEELLNKMNISKNTHFVKHL